MIVLHILLGILKAVGILLLILLGLLLLLIFSLLFCPVGYGIQGENGKDILAFSSGICEGNLQRKHRGNAMYGETVWNSPGKKTGAQEKQQKHCFFSRRSIKRTGAGNRT